MSALIIFVVCLELDGTLDDLLVKRVFNVINWIATTTVLSILSLTTLPTLVFLRFLSVDI